MSQTANHGAVAVIGIGLRFPGADSPEAFWRMLVEGRHAVTDLSRADLAKAGIAADEYEHPDYVAKTILLEDHDRFDAAFFKFTPREAEIADPQHRLLLECAHTALEDAGIRPRQSEAVIGVYSGCAFSTYLLYNLYADRQLFRNLGSMAILSANDKDYCASLIAYKLGLQGPAVAVNTACSTALVAVHMACAAILAGECDLALAGAAKLQLPQGVGYRHEPGGIHAPDGCCRAFDAAAAGTVAGSGAAMVLLKGLAEAIRDGDPIHAVIVGSAVNNDGDRKAGFTAPSVHGQAEVIAEAWEVAGASMARAGYVEAHGTGTPLGDPIEIAALNLAFADCGLPANSIPLGTVKGNLGHLDPAAGIAGLIKTVLALKHERIPPNLHFRKPNPQIDFAGGPFYVQRDALPWSTRAAPRRAGVSSFGVGGTNVHVVLEEAPPLTEQRKSPGRWHWLGLSASTRHSLDAGRTLFGRFMTANPELEPGAITRSLQTGRNAYPHRLAVVGTDTRAMGEALQSADSARILVGVASADAPKTAFLFPGQGSQFPGMARDLYEDEPVFRDKVDALAALMAPALGLDLRGLVWPNTGRDREGSACLDEIRYTLPAILLVELAVAALWRERGIRPDALLGYSFGEYAAAALAGVFSEEAAADLAIARGALMQACGPGAMLSLSLDERACGDLLNERIDLAAINGPRRCILSGDGEALERLARDLERQGVECKSLRVAHAYHSRQMDGILESFGERVAQLRPKPPKIPMVSSLTGAWLTAGEASDPAYWVRHLREPIRFWQGLQTLRAQGSGLFLELGPGRTLCDFAVQLGEESGAAPIALPSLPGHDDGAAGGETMARAGARLWLAGVEAQPPSRPTSRRLHLPTYVYDRRRFWIEPPEPGADNQAPRALADRFFMPTWQRHVRAAPLRPAEPEPGTVWLFLNERGVGRCLARSLAEAGWRVACILPGDGFSLDDGGARIRPEVDGDTAALVEGLLARSGSPKLIVHGWSIDCGDGRDFETCLTRSYLQPMALVRSLHDALGQVPMRWLFLGDGVYRTEDKAGLHPQKALVLGLVRVLPLEYEGTTCGHLDLPLDGDPGMLAAACLDYLRDPHAAATMAFRRRSFWAPVLAPRSLDRPSALPAALRAGTTYLITGGFGALGSAIARYLAEEAGANLILMGRTAPRHLPGDSQDAGRRGDGRDHALIADLEALGARVASWPVDVAQAHALAEVLPRLEAAAGSVSGVFHTAGIPGGGLIQLNDETATRAVLAPKYQGTLALEAYFAERDLDFLLLFGSRIIFSGAPGQANYTAANAVLEAFAAADAARGRNRVRIVHWDVWREAGMGPEAALPRTWQAAHQRHLAAGLSTADGLDALRRILDTTAASIVVAARDPSLPAGTEIEEPGESGLDKEDGGRDRPGLNTPYVAPSGEVELRVAGIWRELLGLEQIGVHDNFFELGGNSLLVSRMAVRLRESFGIQLPLKTLLQTMTTAALADRIARAQAAQWLAQSGTGPADMPYDGERGEL